MTTSAAVTANSFATLAGFAMPGHIVDVGKNAIDGTPPYAAMPRGGATLLGSKPNPAALSAMLKLAHGFPQWGQVTETRSIETVRSDEVGEARGADTGQADAYLSGLQAIGQARAA